MARKLLIACVRPVAEGHMAPENPVAVTRRFQELVIRATRASPSVGVFGRRIGGAVPGERLAPFDDGRAWTYAPPDPTER
jgi:hypothetical protein